MSHVLLIYDEKRLLPDQSALDAIALQHGFEVVLYDLRESTPSLSELLSSLSDQQIPLLWVVLLYTYVPKSPNLEAALTGHVGTPFLLPLLLGTDRFASLFSLEFQHWWMGQWSAALERSSSSFEQFWLSADASVGIISMPFKASRDFEGFLFPWLSRWDADLKAAQTPLSQAGKAVPKSAPVTPKRRVPTPVLVLILLVVSGTLALAAYVHLTATALSLTATPVSTAQTSEPRTALPTAAGATVGATRQNPSPTEPRPQTPTVGVTPSPSQPVASATPTYAGIAPTNTRRPTETIDE